MRTRQFRLILAAAAVTMLMGSCEEKPAPGGSASAPGAGGAKSAPVVLTEANFQAEVLSSTQPVLVDFWATWCVPCKTIAPTVDQIAADYAGRVKVGKVDVDSNAKLSKDYEIEAIPALVVYKNGKVVKKMVGAQEKSQIAAALDAALK